MSVSMDVELLCCELLFDNEWNSLAMLLESTQAVADS